MSLSIPPGVAFYFEGIANFKSVCWIRKPLSIMTPIVASEHGFVQVGDEWVKLNPVSRALIWSISHVNLPGITPFNSREWKHRLDCLYDLGIYFLQTSTLDGPAPIPINYGDIVQHVGLRTALTHEWSNSEFDHWFRNRRYAQIDQNQARTSNRVTRPS